MHLAILINVYFKSLAVVIHCHRVCPRHIIHTAQIVQAGSDLGTVCTVQRLFYTQCQAVVFDSLRVISAVFVDIGYVAEA